MLIRCVYELLLVSLLLPGFCLDVFLELNDFFLSDLQLFVFLDPLSHPLRRIL